jgi:hypothetical protein
MPIFDRKQFKIYRVIKWRFDGTVTALF